VNPSLGGVRQSGQGMEQRSYLRLNRSINIGQQQVGSEVHLFHLCTVLQSGLPERIARSFRGARIVSYNRLRVWETSSRQSDIRLKNGLRCQS
jgi:hypothetical protein